MTGTWDDMYRQLQPIYGGMPTFSTQDMLDAFWKSRGFQGVPGNDQRNAFYIANGAVGTTLGDLEADYWDRIGPNIMVGLGAEFAIEARNSVVGEQAAVNVGTIGTSLNARYGSVVSADTNDPSFLPHTGTTYMHMMNATSNFIQLGSGHPGNGFVTQLVARAHLRAGVNAEIFGRPFGVTGPIVMYYTANLLYVGFIDGIDTPRFQSFATTPIVDQPYWYRVTWNSSTLQFTGEDSPDGVTWRPLGTVATPNGLQSASAGIRVGSGGLGLASTLVDIYRCEWINDGVSQVVYDPSLSGQNGYGPWAVTRPATGRKATLVNRPLWLFGTDDYMEAPTAAVFSRPASGELTAVIVARLHHLPPAGYWSYVGARTNSALPNGWELGGDNVQATAGVVGTVTAAVTVNGPAWTPGNLVVLSMRRDATGITSGVNNTHATRISDAGFNDDMQTSAGLGIGARYATAANFADMEVSAVGVWDRSLSDAEIAQIVSAYGA